MVNAELYIYSTFINNYLKVKKNVIAQVCMYS